MCERELDREEREITVCVKINNLRPNGHVFNQDDAIHYTLKYAHG